MTIRFMKLAVLAVGIALLSGFSSDIRAEEATAGSTLLDQAEAASPSRFEFATDQGAQIQMTEDGKSFFVWWEPAGWQAGDPILVTLHGHSSWAFDEFYLWQAMAAQHGFAVMALQWWFNTGDTMADYYQPHEMYSIIESTFKDKGVTEGSAVLHGFSRGSANSYGVAALDTFRGNRFFKAAIANSGGAALDYPATALVDAGKFGTQPFEGINWIFFCGGHDTDPDSDCDAMKASRDWVTSLGGTETDFIEDQTARHGGFHLRKKNVTRGVQDFMELF